MTLKRDEYNNQVQAMHPFQSQVVALSATSAAGVPFTFVKEPLPPVPNTGTKLAKAQRTMHIRLVSTANAWITFGPAVNDAGVAVTAPVAVRAGSNSTFIPAGIPEYFWVRPGERIAAVADGGAGSLYITELANN